ncbi:MAG: SNF2 helicase associated domain-containing protein [Blautia massiliensis (ex Durand et al. 2017)]
MLKRTAIRALCNTTAYQSGLDIYRTGKRIQSLDIKSEGAVDKISAAVKESGRNVYNTGFQYDTEVDRIKEAYCDCPAFRSYSGICKHCVAVLLEYGDRKAYERVEIRRQQDEEQKQAELFSGTAFPAALSGPGQPATKTTVELKSLLNRQLYSRMLPFSGDPYFGRVELETCLKFNSVRNCFTVEFRVGCEKKYILKDVLAFVWNLDHNEKVSYGKNLEFIHSDEAFSEGSRSVLSFIREWVENHHGTYMSRYEQLKDIAVEKVRDLTVDRKELEDLLLILGEKSFKFKMNNDPETTWHSVREIPDRTLMIRKKDQGLSLEIAPVYSVTGIRYHMYFDNAKVYLVSRQELGAVEEFVTCLERLPAGRGFIDEPDVPAFVRELLPSLKKFFHCDLRDFPEETGLECYKAAYEIYLDAPERDWITCKAFSVYGKDKFSVFDRDVSARTRDIPGELGVFALLSKYFNGYDDQRMELALDCRAEELESLCREGSGKPDSVKASEEKLYQLLTEGIPAMQKVAAVYISQSIKQMRVTKLPNIRLGVSLSAGLLNLDLDVEGMDQAQLFDILSRYDRRKKYFRLKDGSFLDVSDGQLRELSALKNGLQISDRELKKGKTQVPAYRAMYLDSQLKGGDLIKVEKDNAFRALIRNMQTMEEHKFQIPRKQEKILRGYQKEGFYWIKTLKHNQFGGILADDMGLGKTLQVITFLWSEFQESAPGENRRALVITPASLVFNWMNEIERFAPGLPATVVTGDVKERKALIKNAGEREVLITSYDLLKRDLKAYQNLDFAVQIIDEAQYIKNHGTQVAKAVKEIRSEFRLALTGTPVENRLSELWSIFDFLMPGFLVFLRKIS